MNDVSINPEIARLAQLKARSTGCALASELGRAIALEAIINLDPELNLLVLPEDAFCEDETLVQALGVNDLVVNGQHIDVRAIDDHGSAAIKRALVGTQYLASGSLVVNLQGNLKGSIIGFISAESWQIADSKAGLSQYVQVPASGLAEVDLAQLLNSILALAEKHAPPAACDMAELSTFLCHPEQLDMSAQRRIAQALLTQMDLRALALEIVSRWSSPRLSAILTQAGLWNSRAEKLASGLSAKFENLKHKEIKDAVLALGETYGGQVESPEFKNSLFKSLIHKQLLKTLPRADQDRLARVADSVLSGSSVLMAVNDLVKNKVAVDLAMIIGRGRKNLSGFLAASAEELAMAFGQLNLEPAYATHSQQGGVESINEALLLLEAANLADELKQMGDLF